MRQLRIVYRNECSMKVSQSFKGTVHPWEAIYSFTACEIMRNQSFTEICKVIEAHG